MCDKRKHGHCMCDKRKQTLTGMRFSTKFDHKLKYKD